MLYGTLERQGRYWRIWASRPVRDSAKRILATEALGYISREGGFTKKSRLAQHFAGPGAAITFAGHVGVAIIDYPSAGHLCNRRGSYRLMVH